MRLNADSADYVECIYTGLGILPPICQADFYVNKGTSQPGCKNFLGIDDVVCSHMRAVFLYAEAIENQEAFYGKSCSDVEEVYSGSCNNEPGEFLGHAINEEKKVKGIFAVTTNQKSPFGRGRD